MDNINPANDYIVPTTEDTNSECSSSICSDIDEKAQPTTFIDKLKSMRKSLNHILQKSRKARKCIQVIRQEFETTFEHVKADTIKTDNSQVLNISDISYERSSNLNEELKALESQLRLLQARLKMDSQAIEKRNKQQAEIKQLIGEIEFIQSSKESKTCSCKSCIIL